LPREEETLMNRTTKKGIALGGALALGLALAACGPKTASISAVMTDFHYEPQTWTVPAGAEVTLTLTNNGSVEHEWLLLGAGITITPPFDEAAVSDNILVDQDVDAGATATVVFTAPATPGEYEVVCGIAGHIEAGMTGTLIVQ
jgi:plastocyanin